MRLPQIILVFGRSTRLAFNPEPNGIAKVSSESLLHDNNNPRIPLGLLPTISATLSSCSFPFLFPGPVTVCPVPGRTSLCHHLGVILLSASVSGSPSFFCISTPTYILRTHRGSLLTLPTTFFHFRFSSYCFETSSDPLSLALGPPLARARGLLPQCHPQLYSTKPHPFPPSTAVG